MRIHLRAALLSFVVLSMITGCNESKDDGDDEAEAISSTEEALAELPATGQLAIDVGMTPEAAALVGEEECEKFGSGFSAVPCQMEQSINEYASFINGIIEKMKLAPGSAGENGAWNFTVTVDAATASADDKEMLNVYCGENDEKSFTVDQTTLRMTVKRRSGGGADISLDQGLKDGTFVTGLLVGNWQNEANSVGKGMMDYSFTKSTEVSLKQFEESGKDPATFCTTAPNETGVMTLKIDNVSTPRTSSLSFSADHNDPEVAGQSHSLTFYPTETLFVMKMKSHFAGPNDDAPFEPSGELLEDMTYTVVVKEGDGDAFRVVSDVTATGGDRAGKDPVTMRVCDRWEADKMVEGYIGFKSPAAFKKIMDDAAAASPDEPTLDAYRSENEAKYCPTLTEAKL